MSELNAEQIKKALELCSNNDECVGEACPYYKTGCEKNMPKDALALVKELTEKLEAYRQELGEVRVALAEANNDKKELTEENERLRAENKELTYENGELKIQFQEADLTDEEIDLLDEYSKSLQEGIRQAKADTVRKMLSMLCEGRVSNDNVVIVANQIAKEMLEDEK